MVGYFSGLGDADRAVSAVAAAGLRPLALELMDRHCLRAWDSWKNMGLSSEADTILLARSDVGGAAGELEALRIKECFDGAGATWSALSEDEAEAGALF